MQFTGDCTSLSSIFTSTCCWKQRIKKATAGAPAHRRAMSRDGTAPGSAPLSCQTLCSSLCHIRLALRWELSASRRAKNVDVFAFRWRPLVEKFSWREVGGRGQGGDQRSKFLTCVEKGTTVGLQRRARAHIHIFTHTSYALPSWSLRGIWLSVFVGTPYGLGAFPGLFLLWDNSWISRKRAVLGYSISRICCFKNTSAPARGHVLLVGSCPQTWCFLCLKELLRFNGCCIQRMMGIWWSFFF